MIGALTGKIFKGVTNPLVLMVGGVGYRVFVTDKLISCSPTDTPITLFTHTHVRDDVLDLYGFLSQEELTLFELLLTVPGIGPRTALAIIDRGVAAIRKAVAAADVTFFTTIPRVGTKNAQKIIIELKHKLGSVAELDLGREIRGETKDVLDALISIGFTRSEALQAIKELDVEDTGVERKIKHALQLLGKPK